MAFGALELADSAYIKRMSSDQIMQLTYLVLLGAAIGGSAIVAGRSNWGKMAQQAAIWALIFVGVIAAYGLWDDLAQDVNPRQAMIGPSSISVPLGFDGHYGLTLSVNGTDVDFVVDTGASHIVLSHEDARKVGLDPDALTYATVAQTANGTVRTARVTLDSISLGDITDRAVPAVVNAGQMEGSLLGMSYLSRFDRIEISNNALVLHR